MLLSCAKVARRWVSCGEVARRRRGGGLDIVCWARVGDMRPPLESRGEKKHVKWWTGEAPSGEEKGKRQTSLLLAGRLVDDGAVL